jgi:hypothetical protein
MKAPRPNAPELQAALEVLLRACEVEVFGLEDFPFWVPEPWERIGVAGMTRRGKSALLKAWCAWLMKRGVRVVVIDVDDEYSPEGKDRGEECVLGPLRQRLTVGGFLAEMERNPGFLNRKSLALALVPEDPDEDPEAVAEQVLSVGAHLRDAEPLVIIFEECGYWAEHAERLLHAAAARWGKRGHVPIFAGQRLTDVPAKARAQYSAVATGQQTKAHDLDFLQREAGAEVRRAVAILPRKRFVLANLDRARPEDLAEELMQSTRAGQARAQHGRKRRNG